MKPLQILASLATLCALTSCYVWTPPAQGPGGVPTQGGPMLNNAPTPPQTRYIDGPQQGPVPPSLVDPAAPQAPNPIPPPPPTAGGPQLPPSGAQPTPPVTAPTTPAPQPPATSNLPYGIKVPSKPGFVLSPHDKSARIVDVQGIASGTKVKCPYTGKTFLVP
jgi:hypothetical protein